MDDHPRRSHEGWKRVDMTLVDRIKQWLAKNKDANGSVNIGTTLGFVRINCNDATCDDPENPGKPRVMVSVRQATDLERWLKCKAGHRQYI